MGKLGKAFRLFVGDKKESIEKTPSSPVEGGRLVSDLIPLRLRIEQRSRLKHAHDKTIFDLKRHCEELLEGAGFELINAESNISAPLLSLSYTEMGAGAAYVDERVGRYRESNTGGTKIDCAIRLDSQEGAQLFSINLTVGFKQFLTGYSDEAAETLLYRDAVERFRYQTLFRYIGDITMVALGKRPVRAFVEEAFKGDYCEDINENVASILDEFAPEVKTEATIALVDELLGNSDWAMRECAARAIAKISASQQVDTNVLLPALIKAFRDESVGVREQVIDAIRVIGKAVLPQIIEMSRNADGEVRTVGLEMLGMLGKEALGQLGPDVEVALGVVKNILTNASKDRSWEQQRMQDFAFSFLRKIGDRAVPYLIELLRDKDVNLRREAFFALRDIGPEAKAAIPALMQIVDGEDKWAQEKARDALKRIREEGQEADRGEDVT